MILIISNSGDESTNSVIDWINTYHYPFLRVNRDARFRIINYSPNNLNCSINIEQHGYTYDFNDVGTIWYRRGEISFKLSRCTPADEILEAAYAYRKQGKGDALILCAIRRGQGHMVQYRARDAAEEFAFMKYVIGRGDEYGMVAK